MDKTLIEQANSIIDKITCNETKQIIYQGKSIYYDSKSHQFYGVLIVNIERDNLGNYKGDISVNFSTSKLGILAVYTDNKEYFKKNIFEAIKTALKNFE